MKISGKGYSRLREPGPPVGRRPGEARGWEDRPLLGFSPPEPGSPQAHPNPGHAWAGPLGMFAFCPLQAGGNRCGWGHRKAQRSLRFWRGGKLGHGEVDSRRGRPRRQELPPPKRPRGLLAPRIPCSVWASTLLCKPRASGRGQGGVAGPMVGLCQDCPELPMEVPIRAPEVGFLP